LNYLIPEKPVKGFFFGNFLQLAPRLKMPSGLIILAFPLAEIFIKAGEKKWNMTPVPG